MRYVYAVYSGSKWGTTHNRRVAERALRHYGSGILFRMPWRTFYQTGGGGGWDAPTFRIFAEKIMEVSPNLAYCATCGRTAIRETMTGDRCRTCEESSHAV